MNFDFNITNYVIMEKVRKQEFGKKSEQVIEKVINFYNNTESVVARVRINIVLSEGELSNVITTAYLINKGMREFDYDTKKWIDDFAEEIPSVKATEFEIKVYEELEKFFKNNNFTVDYTGMNEEETEMLKEIRKIKYNL